jgi:hypothetical protein
MFRPTLSTVTGDSIALVWVLVAETTISSERFEEDNTSISATSEADLITVSCETTPTPDTTSVTGYLTLEGRFKVKFPLSSVVVPIVVPFTVTDNFPRFKPELFLTLPIKEDVWAETNPEHKTRIKVASVMPTLFISSYLIQS